MRDTLAADRLDFSTSCVRTSVEMMHGVRVNNNTLATALGMMRIEARQPKNGIQKVGQKISDFYLHLPIDIEHTYPN